ncbi:MAG: DUF6273 domain-containing protein [Oscillospiraceae bacterium]|nr:DUF6273 domain-containing protein [Oscillospiraceae bacterium]
MSERYTKLFSLPKNLYAEGSPVIIEAGVLTLDNNTNRVFVQLKFRNISDKEIKALSVTLKAYYVTGKEASEPVKYQYLDFCSHIDEEFGAKTPVLLHENTVRSFSVHVDEVVYADNTVGEVNLDYSESVPEQHLLCKTDGWNNDTASEFKKLTNDKCVYAVCEYKDLWLCSCGCANSLVRDKRCRRCGCAHDFLKSITPEKAQAHINDTIYDDAVTKMQSNSVDGYDRAIDLFNSIRGWKDADDKAKECEKLRKELKQTILEARQAEEKRRKKRNKKIIKFSSISAACIITVVVLVSVINSAIAKNRQYTTAMEEMNAGNYAVAYSGFVQLGKYKDSNEKADELRKSGKLFSNVEVGNVILFGTYEQDNKSANGKEPIEWHVLAKEDNKIFVISKKALDCKPFNTVLVDATWENCSLREWLNKDFLKTAFSQHEQDLIQSTSVSNYLGNTTTDKLFLLDKTEVENYLKFSDRKCAPTAYAIAHGAFTGVMSEKNGEKTCFWWLRSRGLILSSASYCLHNGNFLDNGDSVNREDICVRPAMWITIG